MRKKNKQLMPQGGKDMPDQEKKKSFWETLPGIITAAATLVTAVGGLIVILKPDHVPPHPIR